MKMQKAEMEFITFDARDVITTSNTAGITITINGLYDKCVGNASITHNGNVIFQANGPESSPYDTMLKVVKALNGVLGDDLVGESTRFVCLPSDPEPTDRQEKTLLDLFSTTDSGGDSDYIGYLKYFNGTYEWITGWFEHVRQ